MLNREIYEGWTPQDFIDELSDYIYLVEFDGLEHLKLWLMDNQPYYKKHIPEVFNYFSTRVRFKGDDMGCCVRY